MMQEDGWTTLRMSYKDAQTLIYGNVDEDVDITLDDVIDIWYIKILGISVYDINNANGKIYVTDDRGTNVVVVRFGKNHFAAAMREKRLYEESIPIPNPLNGD